MKARYFMTDSEGRPFTFDLAAIYYKGKLYVRHSPSSGFFLADGIAAPDEVITEEATRPQ